jgi:YegS/Rv2252/BmrU family lipid kinase
MDIVAIVNPISGVGRDGVEARRRVDILERELGRRQLQNEIHLTSGPGHAIELARTARAGGASLVLVWGGDGTVNEAGGALVGGDTALGLIPGGSGNGLAAALGVPRAPAAALAAALAGSRRAIDVGFIAGRPFLNVAGIGFDARVARIFNARGRRGRWPYVVIAVSEGCRYRADEYTIRLDDAEYRLKALFIAFANGREFGMGVRIAPEADLSDGYLNAVVVEDRPLAQRLWDSRHVAFGSLSRASRIVRQRVRCARVESAMSLEFHADGEPGLLEGAAEITVQPGALWVQA